MTTLTARGVVTGAAMLQLIAAHAGMTERDFATGAYLDKLDPALDITARDIITGAYVDKLNAAAPNPVGLMLVPTGATESADGDYQRFAHDGVSAIEVAQGVFFSVWHAELESTARQAEYQVKVKMPVIDTASQEAAVSFAAASITESGFFALSGVNAVALGFLKYQSSVGCRLRVLQGTTVLSSVEITPTPIAGDEITLTLNADSVDYVHGANTGSLPVPNGFFSATPNVLAVSGNINPALIVPLSIKVGEPA